MNYVKWIIIVTLSHQIHFIRFVARFFFYLLPIYLWHTRTKNACKCWKFDWVWMSNGCFVFKSINRFWFYVLCHNRCRCANGTQFSYCTFNDHKQTVKWNISVELKSFFLAHSNHLCKIRYAISKKKKIFAICVTIKYYANSQFVIFQLIYRICGIFFVQSGRLLSTVDNCK